MGEDSIQLFDNQRIRTAWDETREEWLFSVVDVVGALAEADNPRRYWSDLKRKI
ncbi:phage antirepressor protein [Mobiluncus porci]|uniref:Phage antirepressor protein n=1 Tax=Mobiluncus porci TaxID=2652278 RepID=A0A7K0K4G4_9ACTO|nr:phage antirepressor protein [Mobiluncus porci]MST50366.1 phage antirepressor protein [Mobiluncus porci]